MKGHTIPWSEEKGKWRWQTMAKKALHRKQKTGHHDHHLKPGVKWKEPVPAPLV
jgi:hypothetical protein